MVPDVVCFRFLALMTQSAVKKDPRQDIREAYALFDKSGSGQISLEDLRAAAHELGENISEERLEVRGIPHREICSKCKAEQFRTCHAKSGYHSPLSRLMYVTFAPFTAGHAETGRCRR